MNARLMTLGLHNYSSMGMIFLQYVVNLYGVPYHYTKIFTAPVYSNGLEVPGPFTMSVRYLDFEIEYNTLPFRDYLIKTDRAQHTSVGQDKLLSTTCDQLVDGRWNASGATVTVF
jgi:aminoglycoside 3-N-acetyltransferase